MASTPITSVNDSTRQTLLDALRDNISISSGRGSVDSTFESVLSKHDRFGCAPFQLNSENVGLTFFTKPRLNMTTQSIRQDPTLAMMDTMDPKSWMFALRCNLDTVFASRPDIKPLSSASPFFNDESPFNVPIGNTLVGISGFPDFNIEYKTTESGYFSEDMTMVRGADWGRRTYNLNCTFRDIQGGFMMSYFYYWLLAMALQMEGTIVAYSDDREANRLNYTCSIYRFILDPSLRTIVGWCKATGCYPVNIPIGDKYNFSQGDTYIHASTQFNIPFIANHIRYMDPRQLWMFNTLVNRYVGGDVTSGRKVAPVNAASNFVGVPYVDLKSGNNQLQFWAKPEELTDTSSASISTALANLQAQVASTKSTTTSPVIGPVSNVGQATSSSQSSFSAAGGIWA